MLHPLLPRSFVHSAAALTLPLARACAPGAAAAVVSISVAGNGAHGQPCDPSWAPLGSGTSLRVSALGLFDEDGDGPLQHVLIAGGAFSSAGGVSALRIAEWDGTAWAPLGAGLNDEPLAFAVFDEDGNGPNPPRLFAGGFFTAAGGVTTYGIARWDGAAWTDVNGGVRFIGGPGHVADLVVFDDDGPGPNPPALYVGGDFNQAGGVAELVRSVARWDGQGWSALGEGVQSGVSALAVFDPDGAGPARADLIVGGSLFMAGGEPISNIARWTGASWSPLGGGTNGSVSAMQVFDLDGHGPAPARLIVSGSFTSAGGVPVERIAMWNGESWSALPGGGLPDGGAASMTTFDPDGRGPSPTDLIASGFMPTAGGVVVNHIARWDGATWRDLDGGANNSVGAVIGVSDGFRAGPSVLFAGGLFTSIDGIDAARVAAWVGCVPPCPADYNADGQATSDDFFAFLTDFFAGAADFNADGTTDSDDFFAFLAAFFEGC